VGSIRYLKKKFFLRLSRGHAEDSASVVLSLSYTTGSLFSLTTMVRVPVRYDEPTV